MPKLYQRNCAQCQTPFQSYHNATLCCSRTCGNLYRDERLGKLWSPQEEEKLAELAGTKAFPDLVKAYQDWAKFNGLMLRSKSAIGNRMTRLGLSRKATLNGMSIQGLAQTLNIPVYRINMWRDFYGMTCKKISDRITSIPLKQFRKWARANPHQLGGLDAERLEWVLGDRKLAEYCASLPRYTKAIPIKRLDTGVEFPSLSRAAKSAYLDVKSLHHFVSKGCDRFVSGGVEWEVLR